MKIPIASDHLKKKKKRTPILEADRLGLHPGLSTYQPVACLGPCV